MWLSLASCSQSPSAPILAYHLGPKDSIHLVYSVRKVSETKKLLIDVMFTIDSLAQGNYYFHGTLKHMGYDHPETELEKGMNSDYGAFEGSTYNFKMTP